jgi:hypothetical protein
MEIKKRGEKSPKKYSMRSISNGVRSDVPSLDLAVQMLSSKLYFRVFQKETFGPPVTQLSDTI